MTDAFKSRTGKAFPPEAALGARKHRRAPQVIEIPAAITKAELAEVCARYGNANAAAFNGHAPGSLELVTFSGALDKAQGLYTGVYRFAVRDTAAGVRAPAFDFRQLAGLAETAVRTPERVDDELAI